MNNVGQNIGFFNPANNNGNQGSPVQYIIHSDPGHYTTRQNGDKRDAVATFQDHAVLLHTAEVLREYHVSFVIERNSIVIADIDGIDLSEVLDRRSAHNIKTP